MQELDPFPPNFSGIYYYVSELAEYYSTISL